MDWNHERIDLLHRLSLAMGPKRVNKEFIRNCLIVLTILSDQDIGTELKKLIQQI